MKKRNIKDVIYSDINKLSCLGSCPPYGRGGNLLNSLKNFQKIFNEDLKTNKRFKKLVKKNNINSYEAFLINCYSSTCYEPLNQSLFTQFYNEKSSFSILYKNLLNKSLLKLPIHSNKLVFRTILSITDEEIEVKLGWYEKNIGKTITYPTFFSTSNDK